MASTSTAEGSASGVYGTTDITVKIDNLKDSARVSEDVLARTEIHSQIRSVIINAEEPDELDEDGDVITTLGIEEHSADEDDDANSTKSSASGKSDVPVRVRRAAAAEKRMKRLTEPIIQILDAVEDAGGSISEFTWAQETWWDSAGTRPENFWQALWKHARTLQKLDLGFYTHEVHRTQPAEVAFPALKEIYIDCTTAHGDEGSVIEHLFKSSPNLEILSFNYPSCDLPDCQIKNITWDYTFPNLRILKVNGYDFAPNAFAAFLTKCTNVEVFCDSVDDDRYDESVDDLPTTVFPKIRALKQSNYGTTRPLKEWFKSDSERQIRHLALSSRRSGRYDDWATLPNAQAIRTLEFNGEVQEWRWKVPEVDSDDDEAERDRIAGIAKDAAEGKLKPQAEAIKGLLAQLKNVQELGVSLESGNSSTWHGDGQGGGYWEDPAPMTVADVKTIIRTLPPDGNIRALRVWDSQAGTVSEEDLADLGEMPPALHLLSWEGKEKVLYWLEKKDGKVKPKPCKPLRRKVEHSEADWTQSRILEY
ncbi:hypothetical protein BDV96DRAFT_582255 [Lophiotrema nucula]|uniref:F-box domain-containing protein n=1 Tax=Lophiotrema nucula TaxID=690887 RepID=A0A6A5YW89_9PLEO|nr:hypothetical protein BDV96DRAFT_582255 [Lophiotrema nucula]